MSDTPLPPTANPSPTAPPPDQCTPALPPHPDGAWNLILDLADLTRPLDFPAIFGRVAPVHIEIGCGSGVFASRYAQDHPEINLLAMDNQGKQVNRAFDKCRRRGLTNVRFLRTDAVYVVEEHPADASVDAYHIYYSDPWWKKRHHKRRVWSPRLLPILRRTLKPGGQLFLKTDVSAYFDVIQELLAGQDFLDLACERRLDREDPEPADPNYETNYQRKARLEGHPLHYQRWVRR